MAKSIIQSNSHLRESIKKRLDEIGLTLSEIRADADSHGVKMSLPSISRYLNNSDKITLSEQQIIWLGYRYGIFTTLHIGVAKVSENKKISFNVPPYNEAMCLKILKKIFPDGVKNRKPKTKK